MNQDWNKLKTAKDGILAWDAWFAYVLYVTRNGEETTRKVLMDRIINHFSIPNEILDAKYENYPDGESVVENRISFALSLLYQAGALNRPKRAVYQITDKGNALLNKYGEQLDEKILKSQSEYLDYTKELKLRNEKKSIDTYIDDAADVDIEERERIDLNLIVTTRNNEVAIELLDKLQTNSPRFFEKTVVELLDKMGYSGENGEAKVTASSNDGGIDGIINQDPLGTSTVYVQAKRYADKHSVTKPEIQSFYGALAEINADRGVFITTSQFTSGAKTYAKNQGIVLIDGIHLTDLMMEFEVGIEVAKRYTLYQLNNDYFDIE